jgi:hypothetical protein
VRLSAIFLSSIAAAIAVPVLWIALSGELAAITGGAINLMVTFAGISWSAWQLYRSSGDRHILAMAAVSAVAALSSGGMAWLVRHATSRDARPTPLPVRVSFGVFAAILVLVGGALVRGAQVFPWSLRPESAIMFGWIFLGAACYFLHGLWRPAWYNARGQLLGFLAYDVVLLGPYVALFSAQTPAADLYGAVPAGPGLGASVAQAAGDGSIHMGSLIIYVAVLISSAILAIYYLFVNRATGAISHSQSSGGPATGTGRCGVRSGYGRQ